MERGLLPRSFNLVSIGLHCARVLVNMLRCGITIKEQEESLEGMNCHYRAFWRLKLLTAGE